MDYRFQLQPGSRKFRCPDCNKKTFTRYIENESGEYINNDVGRCDRVEKCSYHFTPREYFDMTGEKLKEWNKVETRIIYKPKPGRLPFNMVEATLINYESNQLVQWLSTLPGWSPELAEQTAITYNVGTGKADTDVDGWPIYWQIDNQHEVRSGKLIRYDKNTGKRIKSDGFNFTWIHSLLQKAGRLPTDVSKWSLQQCLFGLHLIQPDDSRPVAIVEGEKTALISSQYLPSMIWVSTGQLNGLNMDKLKPLKGRKIVLFPDKGKAFQEWQKIANELQGYFDISVSNLLENKAPSEHDGYDLADYLTAFNIQLFKGSVCYQDKPKHIHGLNPYAGEIFDSRGYPSDWDEVQPPDEGTNEYSEMIRLIESEFDAVLDTSFNPNEIQPEPLPVDTWRGRNKAV
jgi:hypothetical protein